MYFVGWFGFILPNCRIHIETSPSLPVRKNDILVNVSFLLNPPCKFADYLTILFGNYPHIVLYRKSYMALKLTQHPLTKHLRPYFKSCATLL